jgi:hypothetical protein
MQDLGTIEDDPESEAVAVNRWGQIVGISYGQAGSRAVLWHRGRRVDLAQRIPPGTGWTLAEAWDINDAGWIVGIGSRDGLGRGFLLKPTLACR